MFIASIEANRVKRTRKHLRRGGRSKRRWTFKCTQTRNQHRLTTTNPKPVKIQTCLNQFFWILTDFSFQLFSVGLSLPFEPSSVLNLCSWLLLCRPRCWFHLFIINFFYTHWHLRHYRGALRREWFNTSLFLPLLLELRKTFSTCLIMPNTRCFPATLTWTSTSRLKGWRRVEFFQNFQDYHCIWWRRRRSDGNSRWLNCWSFFWSHDNVRSCLWHCWRQTQLTRFLLHTARLWQDKLAVTTLPEVADFHQLVQFHCLSLFGVYYPQSQCQTVKTPCPELNPFERWNSPDVPSNKTHQFSFAIHTNESLKFQSHVNESTFNIPCWKWWMLTNWVGNFYKNLPNKVQTGLDSFLPETISNGLLSEPLDVWKVIVTQSKHQPNSHEKTWHPTLVHSHQLAKHKKILSVPSCSCSNSNWTMLLECGSTNGERVATSKFPMISPTALSLPRIDSPRVRGRDRDVADE